VSTVSRKARSRSQAAAVLAVVIPLSLALSLAVQFTQPRLGVFEYDDLREGQLEAAGAVVLTLVGGVLLGRVRRDRSRRNLLLGAGLLIVAATELFAAIATPLLDSLSRSTWATWTTAGGCLLGSAVVAAAAWLPERSVPRRRGSLRLTLAAAALALAAIAAGSALLEGRLPAPFEQMPTTVADITPGGEHPALLIAELLTASCFAACAARLALLADAERDRLWGWIAIALGLVAIAFLNYALVPSRYTELLYLGDLFMLFAIGVLLWGALTEITSTEAALVRWAVSSERTRVADELRAGVAQELAFMASQADFLFRRPGQQPALEELAASVARALDESRGAIADLVRPVDEPLPDAIAHVATNLAASAGARVKLDLARDVDVDPSARTALVRLTRECVIQATRDRGARLLLVELRGGRQVILRVVDDGRPARSDELPYRALRERAEAFGATLTTAPLAGTRTLVEVTLR
jgi:signal transduction histidine kinase